MQKPQNPFLKLSTKKLPRLIFLFISVLSMSARAQHIAPVNNIPLTRVDEVVFIHDSLSYMVNNYWSPHKEISVSDDNWKSWRNIWLNVGLAEVATIDTLYFIKNGIYRTDNFGEDWKLLPGTMTADDGNLTTYQDMEYYNGTFLATFVDANLHLNVLYSQDAGDNYEIIDIAEVSNSSSNKWKIKAESATKWWIFPENGNMFRYTEDAGQTWQSLSYQITGKELVLLPEQKLAFVKEGWEFNYNLNGLQAAISSDGGENWNSFDKVLFPLTDSIYVTTLRDNSIFYTIDGYQSQNELEYDFFEKGWFGEIQKAYMTHSTGEVYVVFNTGQVIKSEDTLKTFTAVTDEVMGFTTTKFSGDMGLGHNAGNYNFYQNLYLTEDGGTSWDLLPMPEGDFQGVFYLRQDTISVVMGILDNNLPKLVVYETTDKGQTYQEIQSGIMNTTIRSYYSSMNNDNSYTFYRSDDSLLVLYDNGSSWLTDTPEDMEDFYFYDKNNAVILSHPNNLSAIREVYVTNDMGQTWDTSEVAFSANGYRAEILMNSEGHIFAKNNDIGWVRSKDNGANWDSVLVYDSPSSVKYSHMVQAGPDTLFIYYENDRKFIYSSTDNGETWEKSATWAVDYYNQHFRKYELIYFEQYGSTLNEQALIKNTGVCNENPEIIQNGNTLSVTQTYPFYEWRAPGSLFRYPDMNLLSETLEIPDKGTYIIWTIDENGCPGYNEYNVSEITANMNGEIENLDILVFPVPATAGVLHIDMPEHEILSIQLFDIAGQLVNSFEKDDRTLNVSELSSGMYIVKINTTTGEVAKRVLIMN